MNGSWELWDKASLIYLWDLTTSRWEEYFSWFHSFLISFFLSSWFWLLFLYSLLAVSFYLLIYCLFIQLIIIDNFSLFCKFITIIPTYFLFFVFENLSVEVTWAKYILLNQLIIFSKDKDYAWYKIALLLSLSNPTQHNT